MLDLECQRKDAVAEYNLALATRDGQLDTRLAAERGVKTAYAVNGHSCQEDSEDEVPGAGPATPPANTPAAATDPGAAQKPQ